MNKAPRIILLIFLLLVLAAPMLQYITGVIESAQLGGDVHYAANTKFTWKDWWDGVYQEKKAAHLNDSVGFRPDFVRINNEINYLLFEKLFANGIMVGKNNYLFGKGYATTYCGNDFIGDSAIYERCKKLKYLQDTFARAGKQFLFVYAPSKVRYCPENLPDEYFCDKPKISNYQSMLRFSDSVGIHYIDVNGWFVNMKKTAPHPLFSKQGVHWTVYGSYVAGDSINKYIGRLVGTPLPAIVQDTIVCSTQPQNADDDIGRGLNLIWPVATETLCYPSLHFDNSKGQKKPRVIWISDSFFWVLLYTHIPQGTYQDWQCWFYFNDMWDEAAINGKGEVRHVAEANWMADLERTDVVVMLFTETNLRDLGRGFIEQAYDRMQRKK